MGVCNCSVFCCTLLYALSSIAIILMGKRELIALLNLSSWCLVMVGRLFLAVPRGCLQFVIVVFPDHTHLLFLMRRLSLIGIDAIWQVSLGCLMMRTIASFLRYTGYLNFINGPISRVLLLIIVHVQLLSILVTSCFVCLFCCFTSQVNSYGHCETVSSHHHTFSWAGLNKRLTSDSCTYFCL